MSQKLALIIGNTEYTDPGLAQLTAPGKDAEDFARVLKDKEIGAFDEVKVIVNEPSASVIEAIDEFFDQKKPDDMLVLYFSGHGIKDEIGSLYLAFKNTIRSRLRSTAIKSDYIREAMDQSRSKRQVLILDCCNSGAFPQGTKAELGSAMGMTKVFQGYGRFVLTASDATQFAWEGDKVIGETDNSLFTHYLVKGLEGDADSNGDGRITVDELYDYAYEQISRVTPKQTPTKSASKQEGEIVLRQNIRIEDTIPVPLPDDLLAAMNSSLPYVREGAVRQLEGLLNGKNLGLAHSAHLALERTSMEDDSRRVAHLASQILESVQPSIAAQEADKLAKTQIEHEDNQNTKNSDLLENLAHQTVVEEVVIPEPVHLKTKAAAVKSTQLTISPKSIVLPKWAWVAGGMSGICILIFGLFYLSRALLNSSNIMPIKSTFAPMLTPSLSSIPTSTHRPKSTATTITTHTPTSTDITCFNLLTPRNDASLPAIGKITFSWEAMPNATSYLLKIIMPNGTMIPFETIKTNLIRYAESTSMAGIYQWQVTAYDSTNEPLCTAKSFSYTKPESHLPNPTKDRNNNESNPNESNLPTSVPLHCCDLCLIVCTATPGPGTAGP